MNPLPSEDVKKRMALANDFSKFANRLIEIILATPSDNVPHAWSVMVDPKPDHPCGAIIWSQHPYCVQACQLFIDTPFDRKQEVGHG